MNKESLWRTASVLDAREAFFQEYLSGVMRLADSGTGVGTHPLLGDDGQLGPNARISELLREFLGAPEGEIQMLRMSIPDDTVAPRLQASSAGSSRVDKPADVSTVDEAEKARKSREKQLKKAEMAELERKQREIARREMEQGDLPKNAHRSNRQNRSNGSSGAVGCGEAQKTQQEIAAEEAAARRRAKKAAKERANMPPPAGSPWEVHEDEGRQYWWNRGEHR